MNYRMQTTTVMGILFLLAIALPCVVQGDLTENDRTADVPCDQNKGKSYNLVIATYNADLAKVEKLLKDGADPNARFKHSGKVFAIHGGGWPMLAKNWTPLIALANGRSSKPTLVPIARLLLKHNADIDGDGGEALAKAVHQAHPKFYYTPAQAAIIDAVGQHGTGNDDDIEWPEPSITKTEHWERLAHFLMEKGANVNTIMSNGHGYLRTPLHCAVDNPRLVRSLLRAGARVDIKDTRGETPLDLAVRSGVKESVKLLKDAERKLDNEPRNANPRLRFPRILPCRRRVLGTLR
jgi:ankyrin repeat protein